MVDARAFSFARKMIRRFKTRDPFAIAEALGIKVLFCNDLTQQKGMFKVIERVSFLFVNANLSEEMQKMVCAHELGHALLHRHLGFDGGLVEFELFDMRTETEYDANVFAATLLLDDQEMVEAAMDGYDVVQMARSMGTNVNLVLLKMTEMNKQGHAFRVPYEPKREFLGTIEDNAGEL